MSPVLFCHTLKCVWRSSPLIEGVCAECSAQRSAICSARFSAHIALHPSRLKDEPLWGFLSVQIFERQSPYMVVVFLSGNEGLFCGTIFPKKPILSLLEKDVR